MRKKNQYLTDILDFQAAYRITFDDCQMLKPGGKKGFSFLRSDFRLSDCRRQSLSETYLICPAAIKGAYG